MPIEALTKNVLALDYPIYETLLKNQLTYLQVIQEQHPTHVADTAFWMDVAKRVIDNTMILRQIVGYQPMSGPVGDVWYLRYSNDQAYDKSGKRMSLGYDHANHSASSRKLATRGPLDPNETIKGCTPMFGVDLKAELAALTAFSIADEIIGKVISDLSRISTPFRPERWPFSTTSKSFANEYPSILFTLNAACGEIARRTRRGAGNFIIASPEDIDQLKCSGWVKTDAYEQGPLTHVGTTNLFKIYSSTYLKNRIIVGYKGKQTVTGQHDIDIGYIYTPYVPVSAMGVAGDEIMLATRGDCWVMPRQPGKMCDASDYYVSLQTQ